VRSPLSASARSPEPILNEHVKQSIVLPVHNQADHIAGLVDGYVTALVAHFDSFEILLVTNGCTDDSVAVCGTLEQRHTQVRVTNLERGGWGRAVRHGLSVATGDHLCYTNSARTSAEILSLMLVYSTVYPHVVVKANRRIRETFQRRLGSLLYNLECRSLFDLPIWDINGTPKVFPRGFDKLLELTRNDDLIDAEFNAVCVREGYPIVEVPILATTRHGGRSTTNYGSALRMYAGAYRLAREFGRRR
jgi:glycosyltransferase involved in cell wall biosynthesis